jgi:seryl-tRNA synthetase
LLDIKLIRENPDLIRENIKKKFQPDRLKNLDKLLKADTEWRKLKKEIDDLRHKRNDVSQQINQAKKQGGDVKKLLAEAKKIPELIDEKEKKALLISEEVEEELAQIPNIIHESVPSGKDESENKVIKTCGKPKKFDFTPKTHVELVESLGIADFETSAKTTGAGFYFLKGELALLNQALIRFAIDFMTKKGYLYVETPLMLKKQVLSAAVDLPEFEKLIYEVKGEDLGLIGTAEHSILSMLVGSEIPEDKLPQKIFSYSMCFRKEVGSHGINEKGLWRTHQFNKVEQFIFCKPEESYKYYDELLKNSEEIFQALELPYRINEFCSGALSSWKSKSADLEAWRPTLNDYGELGSLSNCTDFQARDLNIKVVRKNGNREVLHTLNNTAIATSRTMVAILENYQNKDGTITVPKVLQPYMIGIKVIGKKK